MFKLSIWSHSRPGSRCQSGASRAGAVLLSFFAASGTPAAHAQDPAVGYRCAVLGEAAACGSRAAPAPTWIEDRLVPGPYASYLMHLGTAQAAALDAARVAGEVPVRRMLRITRVTRSPQELQLQSIGAPVRAGETVETLLPQP